LKIAVADLPLANPIPLHTSLMPNFTHVPDASNEVDYSLHA
jgi:hypothetical protein